MLPPFLLPFNGRRRLHLLHRPVADRPVLRPVVLAAPVRAGVVSAPVRGVVAPAEGRARLLSRDAVALLQLLVAAPRGTAAPEGGGPVAALVGGGLEALEVVKMFRICAYRYFYVFFVCSDRPTSDGFSTGTGKGCDTFTILVCTTGIGFSTVTGYGTLKGMWTG